MNGRLDGKVAIVTGGASGVGAATVQLMVAEGARVVIADLNLERAAVIADAVGESAIAKRADIRSEADIASVVDTAVKRFGRLDILHNNAVAVLEADTDTIRTPEKAWQEMFEVVVMATVRGCRYAIPFMEQAGGGSIINMSSGAAREATGSKIAYGTMKGGLETLSLYTANTYGVNGIRSNVVAPGFVLTDATRELLDDADIERRVSTSAAGRLCTPEDVAEVVVFLASDEARYVSGQVMTVNGGGSRRMGW